MTFQPAAGEQPVIDATGVGMGIFFNGADYVTIKGLEIRGALFDAISLHSESQNGQVLDAIIDGCRLHSCGGTGVTIYGNSLRPQNTLIQNCMFYNLQLTNAGVFNTLGRFGYIAGRRHDFTRVVHNTFYVNTGVGSAFAVIGDMPSGGTGSHFAEISNNIFVRLSNITGPIYSFPLNGGVNGIPAILDSNVYHDLSTSAFATGTTPAADFLSWVIATNQDLNSIAADPLFVNAGQFDLHLGPGSPAIDASSLQAGVFFDIDGEVRSAIPDIGADEATAACLVPRYQTNSARVSFSVAGVSGTACTPAVTRVASSAMPTFSFTNANVGLGFELFVTFAPLVPRFGGAVVTPGGQYLNVDVLAPTRFFVNGGGFPNFSVPSPASFSGSISPGAPGFVYGAQFVALDPSASEGYVLSQAAQVDVL